MKKNVAILLLFFVFFSQIFPIEREKDITSYGHYIPQTEEQIRSFWKIPELCVLDIKEKTYSMQVCSEYLKVLFEKSNTPEDMKKLTVFERYSDGLGAEMFLDLWINVIKTKPSLFKLFYSALDDNNKRVFGGKFMDFFWKMPQIEKDKWIKYYGLKKHMLQGTEYYW